MGRSTWFNGMLFTGLSLSFVSSLTFSCEDIRIDRRAFNFKELGGRHELYLVDRPEERPGFTNTTFSLDICRNLDKSSEVPKAEDCPNNTRICAIERFTNSIENITTVVNTIPIAGEYTVSGSGGSLDPQISRLNRSSSSSIGYDHGLRLELHGGVHDHQKQKAVIDFLCPTEDEGPLIIAEFELDTGGSQNEEQPAQFDDQHGGMIKFKSWDVEEDIKTLRLDWHSRFACEEADGVAPPESTHHWGIFTWFIIIVFMGVAAYLIFGSWINYSRYSARGWDLLPHSDTLRDVPYLLHDWMRRVIASFQGHGSRGGYSAV